MALLLLACAQIAVAQTGIDRRWADAEKLYSESRKQSEAAAEFEKLLGDLEMEDPRRSRAFEILAAISRTQGKYEDALGWAESGIAAARQSGDHLTEGELLNTKGLSLYGLGHFDDAITALQNSLAVHRRNGDRRQIVIRLSNLGGVTQLRDRYFEARRYYEQALEELDHSEGEAWAAGLRGAVVANLASLYQRLGRYEKALDLYLAARQNVGPGARERAQFLSNLGALYRRLGDPYKAIEAYDEAERLATRERDVSRALSARLNRGIAQLQDLKRLREAERSFEEVVRLAAKSGSPRERLHGDLDLAETRRRLGMIDEAAEGFESALNGAEELGLTEERWKALYGLGQIAEARGESRLAEQRYREAIALIESLRSRLESDSLRREILAGRDAPYDAMIGLMLDLPDADPSCQDTDFCSELVSRISSLHLQAPDGRIDRRRDETAEQRERRMALSATWKKRLDASPLERRALELEIEQLEQEYEALDAPGADETLPESMGLAALQKQLGAETALLIYWSGQNRLLRLWITRNGAGYSARGLSPSDQRLASRFADAASKADGEWKPIAEELGNILLDGLPPLRDRSIRSLLVIPDASLKQIPFDALIAPDNQVAVANWAISFVPSPYRITHANPSWSGPWSLTAAAIAYSEPEEGSGDRRLQFAVDEAAAVAEHLPGRTLLWVEENASREAIENATSGRPPLVHIAAHAILDEEHPELTRLLVAPPGGEGGPADYMLLGDIERSQLRGVRLVVLSACDTARGGTSSGEGAATFSRAFLLAGAESVVAGLWRVPDRETAALMQQFYYELGRGTDRAEALRRAKHLIASEPSTSHPYFWAGFRLEGAATGPLVQLVPWAYLLLAAAGLLLGMGFAARGWRSK